METVLQEDVESQMATITASYGEDIAAEVSSAIYTYRDNLEEVGNFRGVVEGSGKVEGDEDNYTLTAEIIGTQRNAEISLTVTEDTQYYPAVVINPVYTLGEKMEKAALNTLLGMGTVFIVLLLIMAIIYAFGVIPKIEKSMADKKAAQQTSATSKAVDNTIAQIVEKEELSDDLELVAVIAAAIAASEGATSTDGFVVRSIRRANTNKW
ncbi:MAG: OadG family protein [Lachnospiraceae bacterium]|nr:OadG family protein [Lachnospiraceae bacterium]